MRLVVKLLVVCLLGLFLTSCGGHNDDWDAAGVGANPDFTIQISPTSQITSPDDSIQFTVTVTSVNGYSSPVQLTGSGLFAGSTYDFTPSTVTPTALGATSTLNVYVNYTSPLQVYTLTVTGTGPSTTHSTTASVNVEAG